MTHTAPTPWTKGDDGGPAFPPNPGSQILGMSLRDYLAAQAMTGLLFGSVGYIAGSDEPTPYAKGHCNAAVADRSYAMADAMLAARTARGETP